MKKIIEILTYADGTGKRQLREYAKVALGILVLVLVVSAVGAYNRSRMLSDVMAPPFHQTVNR